MLEKNREEVVKRHVFCRTCFTLPVISSLQRHLIFYRVWVWDSSNYSRSERIFLADALQPNKKRKHCCFSIFTHKKVSPGPERPCISEHKSLMILFPYVKSFRGSWVSHRCRPPGALPKGTFTLWQWGVLRWLERCRCGGVATFVGSFEGGKRKCCRFFLAGQFCIFFWGGRRMDEAWFVYGVPCTVVHYPILMKN